MEIVQLGRIPSKPCTVLRWPNVTVMVDCALDTRSLLHYIPATAIQGTRLASLPGYMKTAPSSISASTDEEPTPFAELIDCYGNVFVDAPVQFTPPVLDDCSVDIEGIDAILISNWASMLALPYITEQTGFRGMVYTTDPTLQLGRLVLEELLEFVASIPNESGENAWKKSAEFWKTFPNPPLVDPIEWRLLFTEKEMQNCLAKVQLVAHNETLDLHGYVSATPYSSGFSIGSSNWMFRTDYEKIVVLASSSARSAHPKALDVSRLRDADALLLTTLTATPVHSPEEMIVQLCHTVVNTVKFGGNVLIPCAPTGVLYDLLEMVIAYLDQASLFETAVYFISPVADSTLAYANIFAEWLCETKQNMVYQPEEPFPHAQYVKNGRLKAYKNMHDDFSRDYKTPCVIFAGHPSLRLGEAVHFTEMWRSDPKNAVILSDPDYPLQETLAPFQPLSMKSFFFPIDTQIDFNQVNTKLLKELNPKRLLVHEDYCKPPNSHPHLTDLVLRYPHLQSLSYKSPLMVDMETKFRKVKLNAEIAKSLSLTGAALPAAPLVGFLSAYDNELEIKPILSEKENCDGVSASCYGKLEAHSLVSALRKQGVDPIKVTDKSDDGFTISINNGDIKIEVSEGGRRSNVVCTPYDKNMRKKVANALCQCMKCF